VLIIAPFASAAALRRSARVATGASQPTTRVAFPVPAGACDCHTHIFGDPRRFPFATNRTYTPASASVEEIRKLHRALHTSRVVIVQPSVYGTDNACTLDAIKQRDQVVCGVNTGLAGFSAADSQGNWVGLDVDICKAIAAAVLGDAKKVKWVPLNAQQRFTALQSGEVDILSRNTTFTLTRDASLGLFMTAVTYYDGQGFIVPKKSKITSAKQLKNAEICVQSGTTTEKNLTDYFKSINVKMKPVVFEGFEASVKAFFAGRCQAYTTDASGLASIRMNPVSTWLRTSPARATSLHASRNGPVQVPGSRLVTPCDASARCRARLAPGAGVGMPVNGSVRHSASVAAGMPSSR
jgi:ABC-type amino acid transport substrate-binding protein